MNDERPETPTTPETPTAPASETAAVTEPVKTDGNGVTSPDVPMTREQFDAEKAAATEPTDPFKVEPVDEAKPDEGSAIPQPDVHTAPKTSEESAAEAQESRRLNSPVGMQVQSLKPSDEPEIPARWLGQGTVVEIFGVKMTLLSGVAVTYPEALNEQHFVAIAQHTGNMEANRRHIKLRYSADARLLPLNDQVDDAKDLPEFVAGLTVDEAAKFGIEPDLLEAYKTEAAKA
jgi:hypothetical protein